MDQLLRFLHSWTRWGVLVVAVVAVVWMTLGLIQKRRYDKTGNTLMTVFSSLIGVQWIIGLLFIGVYGGQVGFGIRYFWEHLTVMTLALAAAHAHMAWKRRDIPDSTRFRNNLLVVIGTLILIVVGILTLPSGIQWRFLTSL